MRQVQRQNTGLGVGGLEGVLLDHHTLLSTSSHPTALPMRSTLREVF